MMASIPSKHEVFILGRTLDGKTFRPSDWAERLAGVMSSFGPNDTVNKHGSAHICYSPWCVPTVVEGIKCVVLDIEMQEKEPMAWAFAMNFAKDNNLQTIEACLVPEDRSIERTP